MHQSSVPLNPDASLSLFKMRVDYAYAKHGNEEIRPHYLYSYDFYSERTENPNNRKGPMEIYNGYQQMLKFCLKIIDQGNFKTAKIYANRIQGKPQIDYITQENIWEKVISHKF